ncbi:MAG: ThiS family [Acetobacterium sp.]|jgi:molybdopterin converting factor small subunit|nr:ThiS family [Acetobacterium sp.]
MVIVFYKGELAKLTGKTSEILNVSSLQTLFQYLKKNYSKEIYQTAKRCHITQNGKIIQQKLFEKIALKENDRIVFFPVCSGG